MGYETLIVDQAGAIATITLNRPQARNALDFVMRRELLAALDEIEANPDARAVVLTGAGGHFCAGGDVKTMRKRHTAAEGRGRVELLNRAVLRLANADDRMVDGRRRLACALLRSDRRLTAEIRELFCRSARRRRRGTWFLPRRSAWRAPGAGLHGRHH